MARPAHMLGRNQLTTMCEKDPARCLWVRRWAVVTCRACLDIHVDLVRDQRRRLKEAMDRQGRATSTEVYLQDQQTIERAEQGLRDLGADLDHVRTSIEKELAQLGGTE